MAVIKEVSELMGGIASALRVINESIELKSQTGRVRNLVTPAELDEVINSSALTLKKLNARLKETLSE